MGVLIRRWCRRILQVYKIANKAPAYLKNKLPRHRRALYRHNNNNTFYEIRCKSSRYMNSFFPDGINSWNIVIAHFPNIPSITILKDHVISLIRPVIKTIFNIHDPVGLRYLFHLRVGLSPLRSHKNLHNFIDTPSGNCICNHGIEDTNHFLLLCPLFITQRASLMANVTAILLKYNFDNLLNKSHLLLYGHRTIVFSDNRKIILSTIKFIKETNCFPK